MGLLLKNSPCRPVYGKRYMGFNFDPAQNYNVFNNNSIIQTDYVVLFHSSENKIQFSLSLPPDSNDPIQNFEIREDVYVQRR